MRDLFATRGIRTTCGSKLFDDRILYHDATPIPASLAPASARLRPMALSSYAYISPPLSRWHRWVHMSFSLCTTVRTLAEVDVEDPAQPLHPIHRSRGWNAWGLGLPGGRLATLPGHDCVSVSRIWREQSMVAEEMATRVRGRWCGCIDRSQNFFKNSSIQTVL